MTSNLRPPNETSNLCKVGAIYPLSMSIYISIFLSIHLSIYLSIGWCEDGTAPCVHHRPGGQLPAGAPVRQRGGAPEKDPGAGGG